MLTLELMEKMWPQGDARIAGLRQAIADSADQVFAKYGLDTPLAVAHAMAQFSEECGEGLEVVENLSYTNPTRIAQVWPTRFSAASAMPYVRNPRALANKVYNGRMGNRANSSDGYDFRGRGGSQVTGRDGYTELGAKVGIDIVNNPDWVNDPRWFLECAVADFVLCGCLPFAKRDDLRGVTHHLNGGYTGLNLRAAELKRWKAALNVNEAPQVAGPMGIGAQGWEVEAVQRQLAALGYVVGSIDGDFGNGTRAAVLAFQADNGLPTTGKVDDVTKQALTAARPKPVSEDREKTTADDLRQAGSGTIADADKIKLGGKILAGAGAAAAAAPGSGTPPAAPVAPPDIPAADTIGTVHSWLDQFGVLKEVIQGAQDAMGYIHDHMWVAFIIAGIAVWYFSRSIIARRVADHQSGAHMGR